MFLKSSGCSLFQSFTPAIAVDSHLCIYFLHHFFKEAQRFSSHCVEFACPPGVCVGFLWVLQLPPTHQVRLIGDCL